MRRSSAANSERSLRERRGIAFAASLRRRSAPRSLLTIRAYGSLPVPAAPKFRAVRYTAGRSISATDAANNPMRADAETVPPAADLLPPSVGHKKFSMLNLQIM